MAWISFEAILPSHILDHRDGGSVLVQVPNVLEKHLHLRTIRVFLFSVVNAIQAPVVCLEAIDVFTGRATRVQV
jgi:hypothetical protein